MYFAFLCYHKLVNKDLYITAADWRTTIKGNIKSQITDWRSAEQLSAAAAARRAKKNGGGARRGRRRLLVEDEQRASYADRL